MQNFYCQPPLVNYTMSLLKWPPTKQSLLPRHHGEKSAPLVVPSVAYTEMENVSEILDLEQQPHLLLCVDPRAVNPRSQDRGYLPIAQDASVSVQAASTVQQNWAMQPGGGFYGFNSVPRSPTVKLEMEEFGDLSSYLPATAPKPTSSNSVDELNTPVFDKDAFDFPILIPDKAIFSETSFPLKFEYDTYDNQKTTTFKDDAFSYATDRNISDVGQTDISYISNDGSPQSIDDSTNCDKYSYTSLSPEASVTFRQIQPGIVTPEDSNSSNASDTKPHHLVLRMPMNTNVGNSVVSTPDVIEDVVNLENATFNILDLVNEQDVTSLEAEILSTLTDTSTTATVISSSNLLSMPQKRPRKRKTADDDEDYIPPSKKHSKHLEDSDESDFEEELKKKKCQPRPRGRPPKRTDSVSSDTSKESDVSKYRELRDKNNEASRKSRLKRKIKELEYEKEADELSQKNVRLKAQVEELEKMVNNFRTNLFKIMINK